VGRLGATAALMAAFQMTACNPFGGSAPLTPVPTTAPSPTPNLAQRPSSPVTLRIVTPHDGEVLHGNTAHVEIAVNGGEVVRDTTPDLNPLKGHVHVFLQGSLIYMDYSLKQDIKVVPGQAYALHAEWVGSDHFPFHPRDVTPDILFTVAAS
jgi:hypothetical protein